ncbi:hypothetical protein QQ045_005148 [Rhodiola kirilowii]
METTVNANHLSAAVHRFPAIGQSRQPSRLKRFRSAAPRTRCSISSKKSNYQDLQSYAKPSRLFPTKELRLPTDDSLKKLFSFTDECHSVYTVKLRTSNLYGSSLSDTNAGVLVCLIDENGYSVLHRLSAYEAEASTIQPNSDNVSDAIHFQRGSVDEFTFYGPKLGKIEAIWIGVDSGQWRLGGVNLTLIHARKDTSEQNEEDRNPFFGLRYDFETDEFLLGEGSENSMVELRPSSVTELSLSDSSASMTSEVTQSMSLQSNEESMKAYADLKLSLLLYDSILIFSGTAIASFLAGDEAAFAFLFGGISGFLYLLLLQRSVDGLPSPASASSETKGNFEQMFEGFRSPVSGLAFVIGLTILALKYGSNDPQLSLTPKDLLVGLMGFLTCKVAVLLAAFKPMPIRWNK